MASKDLFKVKDVPMTTVGGSNYDDVSDYSVRKVIYSKEGTITKVPANDFDIANKKYVDDQIIIPGSTTTILNSGASTYAISGAVLFASGSNLAITQTGQQLKWDVIGVPTGSGTSTGTNTGDQTIYATTLNASGAVVISGAVIFASGANIDIVQTGQQIKIINTAAAGLTTSIQASGQTLVSGALVFASGSNITLTQTGQQLKFDVIGLPAASPMTLISKANLVSGATVLEVLNIPTGYNGFYVEYHITAASGANGYDLTLNNSGSGYNNLGYSQVTTTLTGRGTITTVHPLARSVAALDVTNGAGGFIQIFNSPSHFKTILSNAYQGTGSLTSEKWTGTWDSTAEISRITILAESPMKFSSGQMIVWGLN